MLRIFLNAVALSSLVSFAQAGVLVCKMKDNGQGFIPSVAFLDIDEANGMVRYADEFSVMIHKKSFDLPANISNAGVRIKWKMKIPTQKSGEVPIAYSGMYHKGRKDFRMTGMSGFLDNRIQGQGACELYKGKWPK
jgi:hypothetical protein